MEGRFPMHRGGFLESPAIAYETWGRLNEKRDNAILLFTGLSPSAHASSSPQNPAAGWWEDMIGSGLPLDTDRYFVICINSLGSCFGSTGPADIDPATGERYRLRYPVLTLEDVAEGGHAVVRHLGIEKVHTTMGASMGGMSALAYCVRHPERSEQLISISSATRAIPVRHRGAFAAAGNDHQGSQVAERQPTNRTICRSRGSGWRASWG